MGYKMFFGENLTPKITYDFKGLEGRIITLGNACLGSKSDNKKFYLHIKKSNQDFILAVLQKDKIENQNLQTILKIEPGMSLHVEGEGKYEISVTGNFEDMADDMEEEEIIQEEIVKQVNKKVEKKPEPVKIEVKKPEPVKKEVKKPEPVKVESEEEIDEEEEGEDMEDEEGDDMDVEDMEDMEDDEDLEDDEEEEDADLEDAEDEGSDLQEDEGDSDMDSNEEEIQTLLNKKRAKPDSVLATPKSKNEGGLNKSRSLTGTGGHGGPMKCFNCQEEGHAKADCTKPKVFGRNNDPRGPLKCHNCGEEGHIIAACPKPKVGGMNKGREGDARGPM